MLTKLKPKLPDGLWPFLFLLPYLIGFSIFILTPISNAAIGSFTDWGLFSPEREFIGLENFTRLMKLIFRTLVL